MLRWISKNSNGLRLDKARDVSQDQKITKANSFMQFTSFCSNRNWTQTSDNENRESTICGILKSVRSLDR